MCGGYGLFMEAIPIVEKMYITEIDIEITDGDVFFPEFNKDDFDIVVNKTEGEDIKFTRTIYTRKK